MFFDFVAAPQCKEGLDIAIVLDKSKSVKTRNLVIVLDFLKGLIQKFNPAPEADHFGFITFNKRANLVFKFDDLKYQNKQELLQKIDDEPIKLELKTRTDLALEKANDTLFTMKGGDRPDKPNVMLVITDGKPTNPKKDFDFKVFAQHIAQDFEVSVLAKSIFSYNRSTCSI